MGIIKESLFDSNRYKFLIDLGFKYMRGPSGQKGFVKINDHDSIERLWITIIPNKNKVHLYNEFDCGGLLWERTLDIPDECICDNDKTKFIDWLDSQV